MANQLAVAQFLREGPYFRQSNMDNLGKDWIYCIYIVIYIYVYIELYIYIYIYWYIIYIYIYTHLNQLDGWPLKLETCWMDSLLELILFATHGYICNWIYIYILHTVPDKETYLTNNTQVGH